MPQQVSDIKMPQNSGQDSGLTAAPSPTFGQKLVGINFNPSGDDAVGRAKQLCADLMDLVNEQRNNKETSPLANILYNHTVGEILNAQMNVVKLLTLKY